MDSIAGVKVIRAFLESEQERGSSLAMTERTWLHLDSGGGDRLTDPAPSDTQRFYCNRGHLP